jgi:nucleotide-binding universal stress UspA family protein
MYQKVLVPLDGSEVAECALPHLQAIASGCDVVDVVFLKVMEPLSIPGEYVISEGDRVKLESRYRSEAQSYMERIVKQIQEGGLNVRADIIQGEAAESIVDYVDKQKVNLVIMATHGRSGIRRWAMGSVADKVVRHLNVPVLLVRAHKDVCAA